MSYKQRERKRRKAHAMDNAVRTPEAALKWWLTIVSVKTCCAECRGVLKPGVEMVYRATPREARCLACADGIKPKPRPSRRWEQSRRRRP